MRSDLRTAIADADEGALLVEDSPPRAADAALGEGSPSGAARPPWHEECGTAALGCGGDHPATADTPAVTA